jgi:hypothetical protein
MLNEAIENALLAVDTAYALSKYGKTIRPLEIYKEIQNQLIKRKFANGAEAEIRDEAKRLLSDKEFITRIYKELNKYKTPFEEPK